MHMDVIEVTFGLSLLRIKNKYNLSNRELALILRCDLSTITRYLSNKIDVPYKKVQILINEFLRPRNDNINNYLFDENDNGYYYHGSRLGINFPILAFYQSNGERKTKDFGRGFYLGESFKQSSTFVSQEKHGNDRIYKFEFNKNELKEKELKVDDNNYLWVLYIAYNRGKLDNRVPKSLLNRLSNISKDMDLISGEIADDSMSAMMDNFFNNSLTIDQLEKCMTRLSIGKQYCLKTMNAVNKLKLVGIYHLGNTMRRLINEYNISVVNVAIGEANLISNQKDVSGKKYDDILRKYKSYE